MRTVDNWTRAVLTLKDPAKVAEASGYPVETLVAVAKGEAPGDADHVVQIAHGLGMDVPEALYRAGVLSKEAYERDTARRKQN